MPLDWLNTPLDADIGELIARKKRTKAIETLRRQLQGRAAPPVAVRLQLADLLMQAGRVEEAVPVLLGLSDEFAGDGFVAKAVAILKRVDRVQPGRPDIAERLEKLVHQQKRVSSQPVSSRRPVSTFELGMEELGMEELPPASVATPVGFEEAVELPIEAAPPVPPAPPAPAPAEEEPALSAEIELEAEAVPDESDKPQPPEPEPEPQAQAAPVVEVTPETVIPADSEPEILTEPEPVPAPEPEPERGREAELETELEAQPAAAAEPAEDQPSVDEPPAADPVVASEPAAAFAEVEEVSPPEPPPPADPPPAAAPDITPDAIAASPETFSAETASAETSTAESAPGEAPGGDTDKGETTSAGVGVRIRRALWRFLGSLPGAEEERPAPVEPIATSPPPEATSESATTPAAEPTPVEGEATVEAPAPSEPIAEPKSTEPVPEPSVAAPNIEPTAAEPIAEPTAESPLPSLDAEDPLLDVMPPAAEHDAMTEEAFRQNLLDIVEDVLHRPPAPETSEAADRARVLDLAGRLVASRLFKDLSDEELLAIVRGLRLHTFEPGEIVVTEGEAGQSLFTLATGRVKVFVTNPDRRNFEVALLKEGDFFGEISSLSGRPRSATVVAETVCELLELDRPTLDSIARSHARVRDVLESSYIERASSPEAAAVRAVLLPDAGTRRKAIEVLESHFGESRWDPRMRLRLADILLKAGKDEDAIPILIGLADELAREGFADKAVAIIKKIEQVQRRNVEVVNLAPLLRASEVPASRTDAGAGSEGPAPRPRAITDDRFHGWLVDVVRDTVGSPRSAGTSEAETARAGLKGYGPGLLANPLFEGFSEEELVVLIGGLKLLSFDPGDVIVTEGESGQSVFILSTGEVKVFVRGPDRRSVMVGTLGEGSFFGEISTLSGRPRTATVTAAASCEILELDRAALDAITVTHPRVREVLEAFSAARSADPDVARARGERPSA